MNVKIKETFDKLYLNEKQLTAGQLDFIEGCKKYFQRNKTLSEKQFATLREIKKYLPAQDIRFSGSSISKNKTGESISPDNITL